MGGLTCNTVDLKTNKPSEKVFQKRTGLERFLRGSECSLLLTKY